MAWDTIEDAIQVWAVARTGYADSKVIWANQKVPRPAVPFVELAIVGDSRRGVDENLHEDRTSDEEDYPEEELRMWVRSIRDFTVEVRVFTADVTGNATARAIAGELQMAVSLDTATAAFNTAGFSCYQTDGIELVPAIRHVAWEGRASFQMHCYTQTEVEEFATYIETASIEDEIGSSTFMVP